MDDYSLRHYRYNTVLGELVVVTGTNKVIPSERAITGLYFPLHHPSPSTPMLGESTDTPDALQQRTCEQIAQYLTGERSTFDLPICFLHGTDFQRSVWNALVTIPYGSTTSYAHIANAITRPRAVRAVGRAVGSNPISILVPCHRVVGAQGQLTGYAGGLDRKKYLLDLESASAVPLNRLERNP